MNWLVLIFALSSAPVFAQKSHNDFIGNFTKAANENVPGQDLKMYSFSFVDDGDPKVTVKFTPKKISPIKNFSKLSFETQSQLKISANDGKEYYYVNYLDEGTVLTKAGKEIPGLVSKSRMIRKNPATNEVEFLYTNGTWHKVLSASSKIENEDIKKQDDIDAKLTPSGDAGAGPAALKDLIKDPELACGWVGVPKPILVSSPNKKFDKQYFCSNQVHCHNTFLHKGLYDLDAGNYSVSCVTSDKDCSPFLDCMNYDSDDGEFEELKKSIQVNKQ
jgi:hypothetical protein